MSSRGKQRQGRTASPMSVLKRSRCSGIRWRAGWTTGFWEMVVHPDDQGWVKVVRGEALEKRENFECEYRMIRVDGRVVRVREIVSVLSSEENGSSVGGFFFDVTQRREAEESLKESRHFIEQIASASPTISYLYEPAKDQCVYANGRVADILGFSTEVLTEMHPLFIVSLAHPNELEAHKDYFARVMESTDEDGSQPGIPASQRRWSVGLGNQPGMCVRSG